MDSRSKGQAWFENLRHGFSTFCSEADDIICQDSVKYVRTKLITAGENLMHLCSELVEDVLHDFSVDSAGEKGLASCKQEEQDVNFPAQKTLSIGIDTDQDEKSCTVNFASTLLSIEPVGERCTDTQSDGIDEVTHHYCKQTLDGDECNVHAYSSTSAQPPAANSFGKAEESKNSFVESQVYELQDDEVTCCSSVSAKAIQSNCDGPLLHESNQSNCCQKLEESIIMVNSDECYSDSPMEANYLSLENTKVKFCTLKSKIASDRSFESASQGVYSEADRMTEKCCTKLQCAKDLKIVNEDFCDWEII